MKTNEEQWNRWIDGSPSEDSLQENPELAQEYAFHRRLKGDLRAVLPAEQSPPYPDFFNSQIQKRLRDLESAKRQPDSAWWRRWFNLRLFVPVAATALLTLAAVNFGWFGSRSAGSQIVRSYVPTVGVSAEVSYHADANATVLKLEGIPDLPADFDLRLANRPSVSSQWLVSKQPEPTPKKPEQARAAKGEIHYISLPTP